jgi:hypothetical protein
MFPKIRIPITVKLREIKKLKKTGTFKLCLICEERSQSVSEDPAQKGGEVIPGSLRKA